MPRLLDDAVFWLSFGLLACVIYGPWQWYCTDWCRTQLFRMRDELFDLAAKGEVSFESEAYRELRFRIHIFLRFAHRATWPNVLWKIASARIIGDMPVPIDTLPIFRTIALVEDEKVRLKLCTMVDHINVIYTLQMVIRSPLLVAITLILGPPARLLGFGPKMKKKFADDMVAAAQLGAESHARGLSLAA